jgi:K+-transporting ATPase ATPase C chain
VIGSPDRPGFTSVSEYFHGRPSATLGPDPQDSDKRRRSLQCRNSMGSNLGPTSKALIDRVKEDVETAEGREPGDPVPIDLVTTSGSGLDPHITPEAALFQVPRVAKARKLPEDRVRAAGDRASQVEGRDLGGLGRTARQRACLNLALDAAPQ